MDATITDTIHAIAINAGPRPLPLRELRTKIDSYTDLTATREQVDAALIDLFDARLINLAPEENQKTLTGPDRAAALWLGGEHKHLISK